MYHVVLMLVCENICYLYSKSYNVLAFQMVIYLQKAQGNIQNRKLCIVKSMQYNVHTSEVKNVLFFIIKKLTSKKIKCFEMFYYYFPWAINSNGTFCIGLFRWWWKLSKVTWNNAIKSLESMLVFKRLFCSVPCGTNTSEWKILDYRRIQKSNMKVFKLKYD